MLFHEAHKTMKLLNNVAFKMSRIKFQLAESKGFIRKKLVSWTKKWAQHSYCQVYFMFIAFISFGPALSLELNYPILLLNYIQITPISKYIQRNCTLLRICWSKEIVMNFEEIGDTDRR